jgi:hypothetical protein
MEWSLSLIQISKLVVDALISNFGVRTLFIVLLINYSIFFVLGDANLTVHSLAMMAPIFTPVS